MFEWLNLFHSGMTAYITSPVCFEHNMGEGHPEAPQRLVAIREKVLEAGLFDYMQEVVAPEVTDIQLSRVHPPRQINYLESVSPRVGTFRVDTDTAMCSGTVPAMLHAAGAVVKAVDMVMEGKAPNAFCAVRPPGHHAESEKAMGFCFINNVAIGAMHAIAVHHLERILIVDFDVHHGNGTEEIFKDDPRIMFISSFQSPFFPYCGEKPLGTNPNVVNIPMPSGTTGAQFREMVSNVWLPKIRMFKPELIMLSSGFDAHVDDEMANFALDESDYAWITSHLVRQAELYCKGRLVSVLEGGYDVDSLSRSVVAHLKALTGRLDV